MNGLNWKEYKSCTKSIEVEEPLDFALFRPIAYVFIKLTYFLPLTPNFFSLLALISALWAGYFLTLGEEYFLYGGILIFAFAVFDCCDGMIARLKKNGSFYGELIDMFVDLISNISFYLGLFWGLKKQSDNPLLYPYLVFISSGFILWHASIYRFYRTQYEFYLKGDPKGRLNLLDIYRNKLMEIENLKNKKFEKFILRFYLYFSEKQKDETNIQLYSISDYINLNKRIVPAWGWLAGSSHLFLLSISLIFNIVEIYFVFSILIFNILIIFIWNKQKLIYRKMELL